MPEQVVYTLVDKVARVATNPIVLSNDAEAQRYYEEIICRPDSLPAKRPADYVWRKIGTFNRVTGDIINV